MSEPTTNQDALQEGDVPRKLSVPEPEAVRLIQYHRLKRVLLAKESADERRKENFRKDFDHSKTLPPNERLVFVKALRKAWKPIVKETIENTRPSNPVSDETRKAAEYNLRFMGEIDKEIELVKRLAKDEVEEMPFRKDLREPTRLDTRDKTRWPDALVELTRAIDCLIKSGEWPKTRQWQTAADCFLDRNGKNITAKQLSSAYARDKQKNSPAREDLRLILIHSRTMQ